MATLLLRALLRALLPLLTLLALPSWANAVSVMDFAGRKVTLPRPAQRIVALAPHIAENLFSAGAGDKMVGVVSFSNFPPEAAEITEIGSYNAFSLEKIAALEPDLIVMWHSGNGVQALARLEALGIPVYVSELRKLSDISTSIRRLGVLADTSNVADAEALRIERELHQLRTSYTDAPLQSVFYQIWNRPLQTVNGTHLISQVIALCGGRNIFADARTLAPRVSIESVLARDPDVIIASGMNRVRPEWLDDWKRYPALTAVQRDALYFVEPDNIQRPTARVLLGARQLCGLLRTPARDN